MSNNDNNLISNINASNGIDNSNASNGTDKPNKGKDNKTMKTMKTHAIAVTVAFTTASRLSTSYGFKGRCFMCFEKSKQDFCETCLMAKEAVLAASPEEKEVLLQQLLARQEKNGYFLAYGPRPKRYVLICKDADSYVVGTLEAMGVHTSIEEAIKAANCIVSELKELYFAPEIITFRGDETTELLKEIQFVNAKLHKENKSTFFVKVQNTHQLREKAKKENNKGLFSLLKVLDGLADKADKAINPPKDLAAEAAAITVKVENDLFEQLAAAKEAAKAARA